MGSAGRRGGVVGGEFRGSRLMRKVVKHRVTDPGCVFFLEPRGWWARWRYERARGLPCRACFPV